VPELRARIWEELEKARHLFAGVMAKRIGRALDDFEMRVVAMTLVTIAFEASVEWVRTGGRGSILDLFNRGMEVAGFDRLMNRVERSPM
jgi:hypothetical protein